MSAWPNVASSTGITPNMCQNAHCLRNVAILTPKKLKKSFSRAWSKNHPKCPVTKSDLLGTLFMANMSTGLTLCIALGITQKRVQNCAISGNLGHFHPKKLKNQISCARSKNHPKCAGTEIDLLGTLSEANMSTWPNLACTQWESPEIWAKGVFLGGLGHFHTKKNMQKITCPSCLIQKSSHMSG